ncbi:MAG: amino-acid N-acetyltransferase, partial [Acidimicrobiales bacterium]
MSFGGELLTDTQFTPLVHDIMLLHSLGVKLVLVHGARPQVESRLKKLGGEIKIVNGLRITNDLALD